MKTSLAITGSTDRVIESFQQTMQAFLEVQKSTMLAYLAGRGAPGSAGPPVVADRDRRSRSRAVRARRRSAVANPERQGPGDRAGMAMPRTMITGTSRRCATRVTRIATATGNGVDRSASAAVRGGTGSLDDHHPLLETVRDRTGYPIETLGLDLDMEADLGIDSIKRVEILGKLRDEFPGLKALSDSPEMMDAMARARTLGVIVDRMASLAEQSSRLGRRIRKGRPRPSLIAATNGNGKHDRGTLRRLLKVVEAPLPRERAGLMPAGPDRDHRRRPRRWPAVSKTSSWRPACRWSESAAPSHRSTGLRRRPSTPCSTNCDRAVRWRGSFMHFPWEPRRPVRTDRDDWSARVGVEVKGLFLMAKAMAPDLENAARAGGACLIAATALGGRLASDGCDNTDFFPGHGGIAGLVKTLAREWPAVRARVVDFSASDPIETVADRLVSEVFATRRLGRGRLRPGASNPPEDDREPARARGLDARVEARRPRADFRRSPRHHRPGGGRAGTALAADSLDRRHDALARRRRVAPTRWA